VFVTVIDIQQRKAVAFRFPFFVRKEFEING